VKRLKAIWAFWYDFVVGDDWRVAAVVVVALAASALLLHAARVNAWWLLPASVFAALGWSLRRATGKPGRLCPAIYSGGNQAPSPSTRVPSGVSRTPGWLPVVP